MKTFAHPDEMTPRMVATLTQMMESQAYRELAAAQMFGFGLRFVPELRSLKFMSWHIREELGHYEAVVGMYRAFTGESVEPRVNARLAGRPIELADSWFELAMAQFLFDRGGYWQLREYSSCVFLPYRATVAVILEEEAGHQAFGERLVVELCRGGEFQQVKQAHFEKWLRQGMLSFGRPDTEGDRYAVDVGLKKRSAALVMHDFVDDIKPAVKACGLVFPDPKAIGLDVPASLDFSLDGVPSMPRGREHTRSVRLDEEDWRAGSASRRAAIAGRP